MTAPPTWQAILMWILLGAGILVIAASVVGVLVMPNLPDRLHFLTPATSVGAPLVAGAVVVREALSHAGIASILVALTLMVYGPVLGHATIRAARIRRFDDWRPQRNETVHRP